MKQFLNLACLLGKAEGGLARLSRVVILSCSHPAEEDAVASVYTHESVAYKHSFLGQGETLLSLYESVGGRVFHFPFPMSLRLSLVSNTLLLRNSPSPYTFTKGFLYSPY